MIHLQKEWRKLFSKFTKKESFYDGEIPFVRIEDITSSEKFIEKTINTITKTGFDPTFLRMF